mmetsp:Transcript_8306/g.19534  ORF Transcript_8306/g.19534 Transcript_8306/m.19534 type:complete len:476 (+) Transcript_8306:40-1467(+)
MLQSLIQLVCDHFREYDKWPWQRFSSLERQLEEHPSFVGAEVLFLALSTFALFHAIFESGEAGGRRLRLIWTATFIVGTVNDYIFMLLPVVDNFWQAQGVVMLTPRMPLYIPCVYNAFMYWSTVTAARVFYHKWQCPLAEASFAGLLAGIFYAPYDMCGAKLLWWTWHDTDPGVALRWLGVPGGSTAWTITFTFCFSLLLRLGHDLRWGSCATLLLACWSTPLMLIVLNVFTICGCDRIGMPGPQTVSAAVFCFSAMCLWRPRLKAWPKASSPRSLCAEHWSARLALLAYFFTLVSIGMVFSPEKQVSTGVHQEFGPCDATDIDLLGLERKRYICQQRFPHDYFRFNCSKSATASHAATPVEDFSRWTWASPEQSFASGKVASWYTICGQPHHNFRDWSIGLVSLSVAGALCFCGSMSVGTELAQKTTAEEAGCLGPEPATAETNSKKAGEASLRKRMPRTSTPEGAGRGATDHA